jgi:glycosyltransferase involved in cell wall biosynthesis
MSSPQLLFVAPSAYTLGGVQAWLAALVPGLCKLGWQVRVALPQGDCHSYEGYQKVYPELPTVPFQNRSGSGEGRVRSLCSLIEREQPDLVVGVNIADLYATIGRLRERGEFPGRVVMTLHAIEASLLANLRNNRQVIDAVVATNRLSCALCVDEAGIAAERVLYAPYGVPVGPVPPLRVAAADPLRLAWVGRFEQPQKRVHDLRSILEQLDARGLRFILSVAGDGPEAEPLAEHLAPWLRRGVVRMVGSLSTEELRNDFYPNQDVLLITSSWETGPIVAWEAMAAGVVVVSSRYVGSGLEDALHQDETALLFDVGNAAEAVHQIFRLLEPGRMARISAAAHALVRSRYSSEASLAAWRLAFLTILSLPSLPQAPAGTVPDPSGRLDRWIGPGLAEDLRQLMGIRFRHRTPGGEWPHTDRTGEDEEALLVRAAAIEADG